MKKQRASVRRRRKSPRRPTRVRGTFPDDPKPREGGRALRYFQPEAGRGGTSGNRGKTPHPTKSVATRQAVSYFTLPPPPVPFYQKTDEEILAWLSTQAPAYQESARQLAALGSVPVAESERRRSEAPCETCGYDGAPNGFHKATCTAAPIWRRLRKRGWTKPQAQESDDDDD